MGRWYIDPRESKAFSSYKDVHSLHLSICLSVHLHICLYVQLLGNNKGWVYECINRWTNGQTNRQTDKWTDGHID
jgi:hypothetical protein